MKLTKNIILIFTIGLFLISASGIMMVYHECDACGKEEVFINDYSHILHHESDGCCKPSGACSSDVMTEECCKDSLTFFKLADPFLTTQDKIHQVDIQLFCLFLTNNFISDVKPIDRPTEGLFYPPDKPYKDTCALHCIFKI